MDEDEENIHLNLNTPKGKLIKLLEAKCKKPEVDNSLKEILEKYENITEKQKNYLRNGIFNINFAEEALFIQGCAQYYAKRIDKFYDELLASHLRLVQYDEKHAKQTNNSNKRKREERRLELTKLENRLNKSKRKKISLVEPEDEEGDEDTGCSNLTSFVISDLDEKDSQKELPFETDKNIVSEWEALERQHCLTDKVSNVMWEYNSQDYRLQNNAIAGEDHPIYDVNDPEEYNSKYSRVPSYHHVKHLFEYNDNCLLPDCDMVLAKLRLAFCGTKEFFIQNNITKDSFDQYKDDFSAFAEAYYAKERKRIQNMSQNTLQELSNFCNTLLQREEDLVNSTKKQVERNPLNTISLVTFESVIKAPLPDIYNMHMSLTGEGILAKSGMSIADKISPPSGNIIEEIHKSNSLDISGMDPEMEEVDRNKDKSTLTEADLKARSDSGYFESGFETDVEDHDDHDTSNVLTDVEHTEAENTNNNDSSNVLCDGQHAEADGSNNHEGTTANSNVENRQDSPETDKASEETSLTTAEKSNEESDLATTEVIKKENTGENIDQNNIQEEGSEEDLNQTVTVTQGLASQRPVRNRTIIKPPEFKIPRAPVKRRTESTDDDPSQKHKKLSQKQIEKLQKSVIKPVHELKWESFFSMNYQAQTGEGVVYPFNFDSDDSDTEEADPEPAAEDYHSDHDGSHVSEHSYCRPDSAIELGSFQDVSGEIQAPENPLDNLIAQFEEGWDNIIRDHMYTPLIPRSSTNTPVPQTQSETEKSVEEKERKESRRRVDDWKTRMQEKLKKLDEHCFDIHEYGSNIVNSMDLNESRSFSDFARGGNQTEAIRYFITSLHLANTNNIELCGIQPGQLSNDSLSIKLLDKERYHEKLDEYQAPSEEMLRHKLSNMRQKKEQNKAKAATDKENSTWKGKSTPNLKIKSISQRTPHQPKRTKHSDNSASLGYISSEDLQPSTSRQADLNEIEMLTTNRRSSSKRLFEQRKSSSQDSAHDQTFGSVECDLDEFSFFRELEDLQEQSQLPIQSTPRSKVVLNNNYL